MNSQSDHCSLLEIEDMTVRYGAIQALTALSLELRVGEVVGLVGDNGAGKSTLVRVLAGLLQPTAGTMRWNGLAMVLSSPEVARKQGIETIFQDLALCAELTSTENIFLGREVSRLGFRCCSKMSAHATTLLQGLKSDADPNQLVRELSGGQRQAVALSRALLQQPQLLLMDEPTAAMSIRQAKEVLGLIRELRARRVSILVISHSLQDVFAVAQRVVVLRHGLKVADVETADVSVSEIASLITGEREAL